MTDGPDVTGAEIGVDVGAVEVSEALTSVDVSSGDRDASIAPVLQHRRLEAGLITCAGPEALEALLHTPAVVAAAADEVDLLLPALADIAGPEIARYAVEAEAPRVAQVPGPDLLAPAVLVAGEGVVRRDAVLASPQSSRSPSSSTAGTARKPHGSAS